MEPNMSLPDVGEPRRTHQTHDCVAPAAIRLPRTHFHDLPRDFLVEVFKIALDNQRRVIDYLSYLTISRTICGVIKGIVDPQKDIKTCVFIAHMCNDDETVRIYREMGYDNLAPELHASILRKRDHKEILALVDKMSNEPTKTWNTAMFYATRRRDVTLIKTFHNKGANSHQKSINYLHSALARLEDDVQSGRKSADSIKKSRFAIRALITTVEQLSSTPVMRYGYTRRNHMAYLIANLYPDLANPEEILEECMRELDRTPEGGGRPSYQDIIRWIVAQYCR